MHAKTVSRHKKRALGIASLGTVGIPTARANITPEQRIQMIRQPSSLAKDISPPPSRKTTTGPISGPKASNNASPPETAPHAADIEAGQVQITDHLMFFANRHKACSRFTATEIPRISIKDFSELYQRNSHRNGRHFVVTQHDHPVSGNHSCAELQPKTSADLQRRSL